MSEVITTDGVDQTSNEVEYTTVSGEVAPPNLRAMVSRYLALRTQEDDIKAKIASVQDQLLSHMRGSDDYKKIVSSSGTSVSLTCRSKLVVDESQVLPILKKQGLESVCYDTVVGDVTVETLRQYLPKDIFDAVTKKVLNEEKFCLLVSSNEGLKDVVEPFLKDASTYSLMRKEGKKSK